MSTKLIKELRDKTGAGILDCKKALEANDGDVEKAINFLREKGILKQQKKASRIASEGLVVGEVRDHVGVVLEMNSETDFVAKNKDFQDFSQKVLEHLLTHDVKDVEDLKAQKFDGNDQTISESFTELAARIGENLSIRRFAKIKSDDQLTLYLHGSRIGALVELDTDDETLAKDVAMQVAASNPKAVSREDLDPKVVEQEREVLTQQALNEGKPEKIVAKMVEGRLNKFYSQECLLDQAFIKDPDISVAKYLGDKAKVKQFVRYELGEGMEKKEENFAEEVAKQMGQ